MSQTQTATSADVTFRLWRTLADAAAHTTPATLARATSPTQAAAPQAALVHTPDLRRLIAEAEETRLFDIPLDRAVKRLMAQCMLDRPPLTACAFPTADMLARVVIVRSGAMTLLQQLLDRLVLARRDAVVYVVSHERDVAQLRPLCPAADVRPIAYPSGCVGPLDPVALRAVLTERIPHDVHTAFFLDNDASGDGTSVEHIEAAIHARYFPRVYRFRADGTSYDVLSWRWFGELEAAIPALLRWWNDRETRS